MTSRFLPLFGATIALTSCATIWGFEEAVDKDADGGTRPSGLDPSSTPGIVCVPPPPEGWQGPLAIFEASGAALPVLPACTEKFTLAFDANGKPEGPPGACTCACDPQGTYSCAGPVLNLFTDANCGTPCAAANQIVPLKGTNSCQLFTKTGCPASPYGKIADAKPVGAPCAPRTVDGPPTFRWGSEARLCSVVHGIVEPACPSGKIAAPAPLLPFDPGNLCIASVSQNVCPPDYPAPRSYFDPTKLVDTRGCNDCSCDAPKGSCGGQVVTSDKTDCTGGTKTWNVPSVCIKDIVKDTSAFGYTPAGPASSVTCDATGGGPRGEVVTGNPLTVCCRL